MSNNRNLHAAKREKNDEFYTQLSDIEKEMYHYREHFKGKTILCNCDDPRESNFFKFFAYSFEFLGLKKLITTCYGGNKDGRGYYLEYTGTTNGSKTPDLDAIEVHELKGNGDFRSPECIEFLKEADIVITNPPFSLFREYLAQLFEYNKKFIILGHMNATGYKEIFPLFQANKIWYGWNCGGMDYIIPKGYKADCPNCKTDKNGNTLFHMGNTRWYTNLDHKKRHKELILVKRYSKEPELFPSYDNYNAINVDKYKLIPEDYDGVMGVPISFMDHYCPDQFEIVKFRKGDDGKDLRVNGKDLYSRILIRRKK